MSQQTVDYIEEFLSGINFKTFITADSNDGTNTTITVREMFYARAGLTIDLDGTDYTILSVDYDNKQIVVSGVVLRPSEAELQAVKYFHGTPLAVNEELALIPMTSEKAPLLYVYEIIPEDYNHEYNSQLDRTASVRMVFLDDSSQQITTDEHYSYVITPMANLVDKFVSELLADRANLIKDLITVSRRVNHVKFGTYTDGKGHERKIFQDKFTGIELQIDIPFKRVQSCKVIQPNICPSATITDSDGVSTFTVASGGTGACTVVATPSGILYQRPHLSGQWTSLTTYDEGWQVQNGVLPYDNVTNPATIQQLDNTHGQTFFTRLKYNNAFGHKFRFTGKTGGYYDEDLNGYYDVNGVFIGLAQSDSLTAFPDSYVIDHLTGLGWYALQQNTDRTQGLASEMSVVNSGTYAGFTGYHIATVNEVESITRRNDILLNLVLMTGSIRQQYDPFNDLNKEAGITQSRDLYTSTSLTNASNLYYKYGASAYISGANITTQNWAYYICRKHY